MKSFGLRILSVVLLAAGLAPAFATLTEPADDNAGISINQTETPIFPAALSMNGSHYGEARAVISVDAEGRLTDSLVVGYTDRAFGDAAIAALKHWSYEPARVRGRARPSRAAIRFIFKNDLVSVTNVTQDVQKRLIGILEEHYEYKACQLRDLDRIPTPVHVVGPAVAKAYGAHRTVSVEFYIDEEGRVRMPAVERSDADDVYAAAAVAAVEQWRFEPPLRKGRPVLVLARQDFNFRLNP